MDSAGRLKEKLITFSQNAKEIYLGSVNYVPEISLPSSSEFMREYVSCNLPFVVRGAVLDWNATSLWCSDYFRKNLPQKDVTVAVTPDGYADGIHKDKFALPEERKMTFNTFLDIMDGGKNEDGVFYIQQQNSNLTEEMSELLQDCPSDIKWATEAFNKKPDAVNFWMGQGRAVTSMHKDPYENLYCVIDGTKTFTLHPPTDRPFIPYKMFPTVQHSFTDGEWVLKEYEHCSMGEIPWIDIDPLNPNYDKYPFYKYANKIQCTLNKGDLLYLPSLWFHHVSQTDNTIAINYWYDMAFDVKYSYFELLTALADVVQK